MTGATQVKALNDFKILIATPHSYDTIYKQWFIAYEQLKKPSYHRVYMDPSLPLDVNRNNAVRQAKENDCDHVFFLDHDNLPDEEMLVRLLSYNVDVVGALYFERKYPYLPLIYTFEDDYQTVRVEAYYPEAPLVKCDVIGLGCSLFKIGVFDKVEEPWFCYEYDGHIWGTEDIAFFHKLKDRDIPVHIDTKHTCGHLSMHVVDEGDWKYHRDAYMKTVNKRAAELGTNRVFLDKSKNVLVKSPSSKD